MVSGAVRGNAVRIAGVESGRRIPASSPQAKGRIERNHGTHQDRLVKKLRRKAIADLDVANAFLETEYWPDHNARVARPPAAPDDFHVAIPRGVRLEAVFRLEDTRTVSNDWVVRYDNRHFQIERQSHRPPARATVKVYETVDGQIEIHYRDRVMRYQELSAEHRAAQRATAVAAERPAPTAARPSVPAVRRRGQQSADHPWHHVVAQYETGKQLAAARRAWERVQP
jgi:hypothetical protein